MLTPDLGQATSSNTMFYQRNFFIIRYNPAIATQ